MRQDIAPHPGQVLLHEFLVPNNISQVTLAEHLGISFQRVNELINGRRGVTPETALLLAQAFRNSPEFWMALQMQHDLHSYPSLVKRVKPLI